MSNCAGVDGARMRFAAKRIAETPVLGRRLERMANRIVVADRQRRWLMTLDQKQRYSG